MRNRPGFEWERRFYRIRQDLSVMRRLFPWRTTAVLVSFISVMAWLFRDQYIHELNQPLNYVQAVYAVLNMVFFQLAYTDLPTDSGLWPFFVLVPVIGLSLFSLAGFNILQVLRVFFVRRERGQRWQEALAATHDNHVVVCGLGSIGYRVACYLAEFDQSVVGVELTRTPFADDLIDADQPVILGDVRSRDVLGMAGVARAATVVVCTDNDIANIEAAFNVRELNPRARLVLRIFDDELAQSVADMAVADLRVDAVLSRSAIASVAFAYAALGIDVLESFPLHEHNYVLARIPLTAGAPLVGCTVEEAVRGRDATVVFVCRGQELVDEPPLDTCLQAGDDLFVFTPSDRLASLVQQRLGQFPAGENGGVEERSIVVCGLGHVGYRTVNILRSMGYRVQALERASGRLGQRLAQQGVLVQVADFRWRTILGQAGIEEAQAIVICSDDDMVNLETGLRARELNPNVRIVMRVFEEELGRRLSQAFNIDAVYSTSALAAPAFVQAALKLHLAQAVTVGGEEWVLARLTIEPRSALLGRTVGALNDEDGLTVVLHAHRDQIPITPKMDDYIRVADEIVVLILPDRLRQLNRLNRSAGLSQRVWL